MSEGRNLLASVPAAVMKSVEPKMSRHDVMVLLLNSQYSFTDPYEIILTAEAIREYVNNGPLPDLLAPAPASTLPPEAPQAPQAPAPGPTAPRGA